MRRSADREQQLRRAADGARRASSSSPRPARENLLTWYSTYGNNVDVAAPGGSRFQTPTFDGSRGRVLAPYSSTAGTSTSRRRLGRLVKDPATGDYYAWLNGTSMAAPHASGSTALIRRGPSRMSQWRGGRHAPCAEPRRSAVLSALDPGVEFFGAPVQVCSGRCRLEQLLRRGLGERAGCYSVIDSPRPGRSSRAGGSISRLSPWKSRPAGVGSAGWRRRALADRRARSRVRRVSGPAASPSAIAGRARRRPRPSRSAAGGWSSAAGRPIARPAGRRSRRR